jgi:hypothetical protein
MPVLAANDLPEHTPALIQCAFFEAVGTVPNVLRR